MNGLLAVDLRVEDLHLMGIHNELHRRRVMLELRHLYGPEGWEEALHGLDPEQLVHPTALPPALDVAPPVAPPCGATAVAVPDLATAARGADAQGSFPACCRHASALGGGGARGCGGLAAGHETRGL